MKPDFAILFRKYFNAEPVVVRSPGRINIIGEHTDYNEGFVLPAAIDKYVYIAASANGTHDIRLHSVAFDERIELTTSSIQKYPGSWANYIIGVVAELQKAGHTIGGFDLLVDGDLPIGAGLSSSAAIECATCQALNTLFDLELGLKEIIQYAQLAEHNYAGVYCGIMDQFASVRGKKHHAILLDCKRIEHQYVPLHLEGYKLLLLNSNVKHALASSEYNIRRQECMEVTSIIQRYLPSVRSLRDVSFNLLVEHIQDPVLFSRAKFVIEENSRVLKATQYLQSDNITGLGQQLYKSHDGLSQDYQVSCRELDWLVSAVRYRPEVAGARMMGGGFGGCTINIVREDKVEQLTEQLSAEYEQSMGKPLSAYIVNITNGTELLTAPVNV